MPDESKPVPRCEVVDEDRFMLVHDCHDLDLVDGKLQQTPTPGDVRYLPLQTETRQAGWSWVGEPGQTITPSIHCERCGTHGWWRDGAWQTAQ